MTPHRQQIEEIVAAALRRVGAERDAYLDSACGSDADLRSAVDSLLANASRAPVNVTSKKPYRGVNTLCLWAAAQAKGYERGEWGTYEQWHERGAQSVSFMSKLGETKAAPDPSNSLRQKVRL